MGREARPDAFISTPLQGYLYHRTPYYTTAFPRPARRFRPGPQKSAARCGKGKTHGNVAAGFFDDPAPRCGKGKTQFLK
jgi:hypothetical protein